MSRSSFTILVIPSADQTLDVELTRQRLAGLAILTQRAPGQAKETLHP